MAEGVLLKTLELADFIDDCKAYFDDLGAIFDDLKSVFDDLRVHFDDLMCQPALSP